MEIQMKKVTIVIPVFNEETSIEANLKSILGTINTVKQIDFSILLVDDGSTDFTVKEIKSLCCSHDNLEIICLTRNFGKEAAIEAGLNSAEGDAVIIMDSDLQHPPELIPQMITLWEKGIYVVEAIKISRGKEPFLARFFANSFYSMFLMLTNMNLKNYSDFKLLDREVINTLCNLPEKQRFFRGLVCWLGFPAAQIPFNVPDRTIGTSSWSRYKLLKTSIVALSGFSTKPLQIISLLGIATLIISVLFGSIALWDKISGNAVSGFTTVILLILIIGSLLMCGIGILGIYIGHIFNEIKCRPTSIINKTDSNSKNT